MRYCDYCGAELPENARFCGICGHIPGEAPKSVTSIMNPSPLNLTLPATPPLFSNSSFPPSERAPSSPQDGEMTIKTTWSQEEEFNPQTWHYLDLQSDEYQTIGPEVIAPLAAGGLGQIPASSVPVVPGTPQIGGVPAVQGTPQMGNGPAVQGNPHLAGHAPAPHELAHQAPSSPSPSSPSPSAPQHAWTWEHHATHPHHQQHQPLHHQQHSMPPEQHHPAHKARWRHGHEHIKHGRTHRFHMGRAHHTGMATTSKAATGIAAKWAIILLAAVVVMASGGIIFVLASSPALSLSSSGTVSVGGMLQLHGRGFVPGGSITLTVDNGLPATLAGSRPLPGALAGSGAANLADMLNTTRSQNANSTIVVGITGTFDANVAAQSSWPAGRNILHAKENTGSRVADVTFTLLAQPAHLVINPATLDFGAIPQGSRVAESVLIGDSGGSPLNWNATTGGSPWLALQSNSGALQPNGAQDALYALVDTGKLKQGTYSAEISIHSNGGNAQIAVLMRVGPPLTTRQAQLNVNPAHLDFGQLTPGQQVTNTLTIGNQGTLALQWQGSINGASWLSLSLSNGSVNPGGIPQSVQVTVDTRNSSLQTGSNTASIIIHSNGGTVTIPVTLALLSGNTPSPSPTVSPSPTTIPSPSPTLSTSPSPTPSPSPTGTSQSLLSVNPGSIYANNNCTWQTQHIDWYCTVTLASDINNASNLNWTASSSAPGNVIITFSQQSGTLSPGQSVQIIVGIHYMFCPGTLTLTFTGSSNSVNVPWSCTQVIPSLHITPATINANTDCSYSNGWTCTTTLSNSSSNQATAKWAIGSNLSSMTFTPSSGTLAPGNSIPITIFVPGTSVTCPTLVPIDVTGSDAPLGNNWICGAPNLIASPSSLASGSPCTFDSARSGYTCVETVQEDPTSQGNLAWSVSSTMPGVSYSQSSGALSPGQSTQITITGIPCALNGSFTFSGGANPVNVPWLCGS